MIAWLKGKVLDIDGNEVILNSGNVGYRVILGDNYIYQIGLKKGDETEIAVYTAVREDEIRLFGFDSFFTRKVFVLLLGVNGVGPKAAMNIVDQLESAQVLVSIRHNDVNPFLGVSGIGKKTAQRIILDLQGKIDQFDNLAVLPEYSDSTGTNLDDSKIQSQLMKDAGSALSNLGFLEKEADRVIRKHAKPGVTLNEIIRKSLADLRQ